MSDNLESIISNSISSLPGSDASSSVSESVTDTPVGGASDDSVNIDDSPTADAQVIPDVADATPPAAPVAEPEAPPVVSDDTLDSLKAELAGKRDNRIPYSRVTKIVDKAVATATAVAKQEAEASVAQYRTPEFQNGLTAMRVADESPEQFLTALAQADPRYAALLQGSSLVAPKAPAGQPAAQQAPAEGSVEPDIQLSDGTLGYSADAIKRVLAAERTAMTKLFETQLGERMKGLEPIQQEHRIGKMRAEAETRVTAKVAAAEKWPGFKEAQEEIAGAIHAATQRGETLSLEDAYIQHAIPKMQKKYTTDEAAVRAKVVAEMNKAARAATGVAPAAPAGPVGPAGDTDSLEAVIRASLKR